MNTIPVEFKYISAKQKPLYKQLVDKVFYYALYLGILYLFTLEKKFELDFYPFIVIGFSILFLLESWRMLKNYFLGPQVIEVTGEKIVLNYKDRKEVIFIKDVLYFNRCYSIGKNRIYWIENFNILLKDRKVYIRLRSLYKNDCQKIETFFREINEYLFQKSWREIKEEYKDISLNQVMNLNKNINYDTDKNILEMRWKKIPLNDFKYIEYGDLYNDAAALVSVYLSPEAKKSKYIGYVERRNGTNRLERRRGDIALLLYLEKNGKISLKVKSYLNMRLI